MPTLPTGEISLLVHALQSMKDHAVLQHPGVAVSNTRSPPKLYVPARKRKKKFETRRRLRRNMKQPSIRTGNKGGTSSIVMAPLKSTRK